MKDKDEIVRAFKAAVNMSPAELETWLGRPESKAAGWRRTGSRESIGHESGHKIVAIKRKRKGDLTDAEVKHMNRVAGYVRRHLAQRPSGDMRDTKWRHSLMNWGHDPLKER